MVLIVVLIVLAALAFALFKGSIQKSDGHKVSQRTWREQIVRELGLGEHLQGNSHTLGLTKDRAKLAVVNASGDGFWIPLSCVRHIELTETFQTSHEDTAQTSTDRGSQLGGALIGGAIAGPVGFAVGGLSGNKTTISEGRSETYVSSVTLRLDLRNDALPMYFSFADGEWEPATKSFVGGIAEARQFADRLRWEVEKLASATAEVAPPEHLQTIRVAARPASTEGWWTSTFGG